MRLNVKTALLDGLIFSLSAIIFFVLLAVMNYPLGWLGSMDSLEIAQSMLAHQHWLQPMLNGVIQLNKPPLFYWLTASSLAVLGHHLAAAYLWPMLSPIITSLCLYSFALLLASRRVALIAATTYLTTILVLGVSLSASLYTTYNALLTLSLFSLFLLGNGAHLPKTAPWFLAYKSQCYRVLNLVFWLSNAAGFLLLGWGGLCLPLTISAIYLMLIKRVTAITQPGAVQAFSLFLFIALLWFMLSEYHSPGFLYEFGVSIPSDFVSGLFTSTAAYGQVLFLIFFVGLILLLPWSLLLPLSMAKIYRFPWTNRQRHPLRLFFLIWSFIAFLFIMLASVANLSNLPLLIVITPIFSLGTALTIDRYWQTYSQILTKSGRSLTLLFLSFVVLVFCVINYYPEILGSNVQLIIINFLQANGNCTLIMSVLSLSLIYLGLRFSHRFWQIICVFALSGILLAVALNFTMTKLKQEQTKPVSDYIARYYHPEDVIASYAQYYPSIAFETQQNQMVVIDWPNPPQYGFNHQDISGWVVSNDFFWQVMARNHRRLFLIIPNKKIDSVYAQIQAHAMKLVVKTSANQLWVGGG